MSLLILFILWQFGVFPGIPYGGKAIALIVGESIATQTTTVQSISAEAILPLASVDAEAVESMTTLTEEAAAFVQPEADTVVSVMTEVMATPTKAPALCNGIPSRIGKGMQGQIHSGGVSSNLREAPSTDGPSLGVLKPEMTFVVESDEAVCALGYLWIKIRINETDETGWTVEAKGDQYWLTPVNNE